MPHNTCMPLITTGVLDNSSYRCAWLRCHPPEKAHVTPSRVLRAGSAVKAWYTAQPLLLRVVLTVMICLVCHASDSAPGSLGKGDRRMAAGQSGNTQVQASVRFNVNAPASLQDCELFMLERSGGMSHIMHSGASSVNTMLSSLHDLHDLHDHPAIPCCFYSNIYMCCFY